MTQMQGGRNDRGPGRRTNVFIEGRPEPLVASRTEQAILEDMGATDSGFQLQALREGASELLEALHELRLPGGVLGQLRKAQCPIPGADLGVVDGLGVLVGAGDEVVGQLFADLLRAGSRGPVGEVVLLRVGDGEGAKNQASRKKKTKTHHGLVRFFVSFDGAPILSMWTYHWIPI